MTPIERALREENAELRGALERLRLEALHFVNGGFGRAHLVDAIAEAVRTLRRIQASSKRAK